MPRPIATTWNLPPGRRPLRSKLQERKLDEALGALTKELRELRDAEERRQRDARFSRLLERRPVKSDSDLFEVPTALAPAAAPAALAAALIRRFESDVSERLRRLS